MTLAERLVGVRPRRFTGIWVRPHEHDDAIAEVAGLCRDQGWTLATWDVDRGLALAGRARRRRRRPAPPTPWPRSARWPPWPRPTAPPSWCCATSTASWARAEVVQALDTQLAAGKQDRTFVVILAPVVQLPVELEKHFVVVEHDLPGRDQLEAIARGVATEPGELPDGRRPGGRARRGRRADPRRGREGLRAVAGPPRPARPRGPVGDQGRDAQEVGPADPAPGRRDRSPAWAAWRPSRRSARAPCGPAGRRASGPGASCCSGRRARARSAFAKALGHETGRPTLVLDVGALLGSLVGQTEANVRQALRLVDAMAPCVVMVDEVEKALAGVVGAVGRLGRLGAALRRAADLAQRPGERRVRRLHEQRRLAGCRRSSRGAERFDATFFLDLPGPPEKRRSGGCTASGTASTPVSRGRRTATGPGARSRSCCRLAALLGRAAGRGGREHRPGGGDGRRAGRAAADVGGGAVPDADRPGLYARATDVRQGRRTSAATPRPTEPTGRPDPTDPGHPDDRTAPTTRRPRPIATQETSDDHPARPHRLTARRRPPPAHDPRPPSGSAPPWPPAGSRSPGSAPRSRSTPEQRAPAAETFDAEGQLLSAGKKLLDTEPPRLPRRHRRPRQGRRLLEGLSLPFPEPGVRLIKQDEVEAFAAQMADYKAELDDAVTNLDRHYGELKRAAQEGLLEPVQPIGAPFHVLTGFPFILLQVGCGGHDDGSPD